MNYFPALLNLENRVCLVVGGGSIAERKIKSLLLCGAKVRVISPDLTVALQEATDRNEFEYIRREFEPGDTKDAFVVICATNDENTNKQVAEECHGLDKPVNVVDDSPKCSFILPAVMRQGSLTISVSTSGKSPLMAAKIRRRLDKEYGRGYAEILDLLGDLRERILKSEKDSKHRLNMFETLLTDKSMELLEQGKFEEVKERVLNAYRSFGDKP